MKEFRLQTYISKCGIASRRKAEDLIKDGKVKVNGRLITEMGFKVNYGDLIEFDGKKIALQEEKIYILLNKPVGYVTTVRDQFKRKTVMDLISGIKERIYPVGRLDYDTSGLLVLTNDGEFTFKITHPRHEIDKVYLVEIEGNLSGDELNVFEKGIDIGGFVTSPARINVLQRGVKTSTVEVTIHEGKNRQVRKMFEVIGHKVLSLKRISLGNIVLGDLHEGKWRYLRTDEIDNLLKNG